MGCVYAGYDEKLGRRVAVKAVHADLLDAEARARLIREARALAKIDHPSLCRVYDVLEHEGADLLALEFIEGRTLRAAVEAGLSFDEKLRIASAIADVLAAAHRAGILHRDLKPENVMLTHAGEVKVLDFGLARFLDVEAETRTEPAAQRRPAALREIDSQTNVGIVVGTPLYMSPEQARGNSLTTASDMYSFGLLLQYLFDGRDAHDDDLGVNEVLGRAATATTHPFATRDSDLRVLVAALKSLAPTDRPTAVLAHKRLEAIRARPKRRARIVAVAAVLVLLIGGAVKYAVDLHRERIEALAARAEADARRAEADEILGFMVDDLSQRLEAVGSLEVLDAVAHKTLTYFAELKPDEISQQDRQRNADVLLQIGSIRLRQGKSDQAVIAFNHALDMAGRALQENPRDAETLYVLGRAHSWLGIIHYRNRDTEAGIAEMEQYLQAAKKLVAMSPDDPKSRGELAFANINLGSFAESSGDLDKAINHYEQALAVTVESSRRDPADMKVRIDVTRSTNKIALALFKVGRLAEARARFEEERKLLESILASDAKNEAVRQRLAVNHDYLGMVKLNVGDVDGALAEFESDIALQKRAVANDPENMTWRRNLAAAHRQMGDALRYRDLGRAAETYSLAASMMSTVTAKKSEIEPPLEMAMIQIGWSRALLAKGNASQARSHLQKAVTLLEPLKAESARNRTLGVALITLGEIDAATGDDTLARQHWLDAERTLPPRTANLRDPRILDAWSRLLLHLGRDAEAQPILTSLDAMGYRNADLEALRKR